MVSGDNGDDGDDEFYWENQEQEKRQDKKK